MSVPPTAPTSIGTGTQTTILIDTSIRMGGAPVLVAPAAVALHIGKGAVAGMAIELAFQQIVEDREAKDIEWEYVAIAGGAGAVFPGLGTVAVRVGSGVRMAAAGVKRIGCYKRGLSRGGGGDVKRLKNKIEKQKRRTEAYHSETAEVVAQSASGVLVSRGMLEGLKEREERERKRNDKPKRLE